MNISELASDLKGLFYPKLCTLCSDQLLSAEEYLCATCHADLPMTNFHLHTDNALDQKLKGRLVYNKAFSMYYFNTQGAVRDVLYQIKYQRNNYLANYFGEQLGHYYKSQLKNIDVIIPVPLHPKRIAERGYNQSKLLADGINKVTKTPVNVDLVKRIKNTETQTHKSRIERVENMLAAFEWQKSDLLKSKSILLIDDVITTGSTLESCIRSAPIEIRNNFSILTLAAAIDS